MTIYVPVTKFDRGGVIRGIEALDSDKCRMLGGCIESCGIIYGSHAYTDPDGVRLFWNRENWKAEQYRYRF